VRQGEFIKRIAADQLERVHHAPSPANRLPCGLWRAGSRFGEGGQVDSILPVGRRVSGQRKLVLGVEKCALADVALEGVPRLLKFESPAWGGFGVSSCTQRENRGREGKSKTERRASPWHSDSDPIE
jgi:hypothetical protein